MPKSNKYLRITMRGGLRVNVMLIYLLDLKIDEEELEEL